MERPEADLPAFETIWGRIGSDSECKGAKVIGTASGKGCEEKRQRTAAVQDADARFGSRLAMAKLPECSDAVNILESDLVGCGVRRGAE